MRRESSASRASKNPTRQNHHLDFWPTELGPQRYMVKASPLYTCSKPGNDQRLEWAALEPCGLNGHSSGHYWMLNPTLDPKCTISIAIVHQWDKDLPCSLE